MRDADADQSGPVLADWALRATSGDFVESATFGLTATVNRRLTAARSQVRVARSNLTRQGTAATIRDVGGPDSRLAKAYGSSPWPG